MAATRPTAVNLFWAIERMKRAFADGARRPASRSMRSRQRLDARGATRSTTRTSRAAARWARTAPTLVPDDARILTHCNAGALATAGYGTALGVIRGAVEAGQEGRGACRRDAAVPAGRAADRVGAGQDGIDTTVITDNMAGALMRAGHVDLVVVGADRIAANGDIANKIGTYARRRAGEGARHPVLRRGAAVDDRSGHAGRQRAFRSRSATRAR